MLHVSLFVSHDLHFNVAGPTHQALDIQRPVAKRAQCLRLTTSKGSLKIISWFDYPGAPATSSGNRLQHDRRSGPERTTESLSFGEIYRNACAFGHRHAGGNRACPSRRLVSEQVQQFWSWADERQPGQCTAAGEVTVFGQEAVAGVYRIAAGPRGRFDQTFGIQERANTGSR